MGIGPFYLWYSNLYLVLDIGIVMFLFFSGEPPVHFVAVSHLIGHQNMGLVLGYFNVFSVGTAILFGPTVMADVSNFT